MKWPLAVVRALHRAVPYLALLLVVLEQPDVALQLALQLAAAVL